MDAQDDKVVEERQDVESQDTEKVPDAVAGVTTFIPRRIARTLSKTLSTITRFMGFSSEEDLRTLEQIIIDSAEKEKMMIGGEVIEKWGLLFSDNSDQHFIRELAQATGFKDVIVHGTLIAAYAEQYVLGLLKEIESMRKKYIEKNPDYRCPKEELVYTGHSIEFKRPLYPKERAKWGLLDVVEAAEELPLATPTSNGSEIKEKKSVGLNLYTLALDSNEKPIVLCPSVPLRFSRPCLGQEEIDSFLARKDIVARGKRALPEKKEAKLKLFYELLDKPYTPEIPMMYLPACLPSFLIGLLSRETGESEGTYLGLDFEFYNQPHFGVFDFALATSSGPTLSRGFYECAFDALCLQEGNAIFKGKINCRSQTEIKLD